MNNPLNQYRTLAGLLTLGVLMIVALGICRGIANGPTMLTTVVTGLGGLGLWLAGKSASEHAFNAVSATKAKEPAASVLAGAAAKAP